MLKSRIQIPVSTDLFRSNVEEVKPFERFVGKTWSVCNNRSSLTWLDRHVDKSILNKNGPMS